MQDHLSCNSTLTLLLPLGGDGRHFRHFHVDIRLSWSGHQAGDSGKDKGDLRCYLTSGSLLHVLVKTIAQEIPSASFELSLRDSNKATHRRPKFDGRKVPPGCFPQPVSPLCLVPVHLGLRSGPASWWGLHF